MRIVVTGATGFLGRRICATLLRQGYEVYAAVRSPSSAALPELAGIPLRPAPDLSSEADWRETLKGVEAVIHTAARVHQRSQASPTLLELYRRVNRNGTATLAQQAAELGVQRFVFVSSIHVNGILTEGQPFREEEIPHPTTPYGISKWEAELALREIGEATGMAITIVRPPLVVGPYLRANLLRLFQWIHWGLPLPFASIRNLRSYIGLSALTDFLITCLLHPAAQGEIFLIKSGEDLSTPDLARTIAEALGTRAILFPSPPLLFRFLSWILRMPDLETTLCRSLQIDATKAHQRLGWKPPRSLREEFLETAAWLKHQQGKGEGG